VGYPEFIYNDTFLNSLYADFYVKEPDYLRNSLHILKLKVREDLEKLRTVQDKDAWITGPAIVNAFYSSYSNQICLPAGILQAPFYDAQYPK
jgi:predicted metalloendopeptidase